MGAREYDAVRRRRAVERQTLAAYLVLAASGRHDWAAGRCRHIQTAAAAQARSVGADLAGADGRYKVTALPPVGRLPERWWSYRAGDAAVAVVERGTLGDVLAMIRRLGLEPDATSH